MNVFKRVTFFSLVLTSAISAERLDQTALAMYGSAVNAVGQLAENVQPMCEFAKEKVTEAVNAVVVSDAYVAVQDAVRRLAEATQPEYELAKEKVTQAVEALVASDAFAKAVIVAQDYKAEVAGALIGAGLIYKLLGKQKTSERQAAKAFAVAWYGWLGMMCASLIKDTTVAGDGMLDCFMESFTAPTQFFGFVIDSLKSVATTAIDEINKHPKAALAGAVAGALVYKVVTDARAKNNSKNVYNQYPYVVSC